METPKKVGRRNVEYRTVKVIEHRSTPHDYRAALEADVSASQLLLAISEKYARDARIAGDALAEAVHLIEAARTAQTLRAATALLATLEPGPIAVVDDDASSANSQTSISIHVRLENWAKVMRGGQSSHATSMTGIICESMKKWHGDVDGQSGPATELDDADAELIHRAWKRCPVYQQNLLWYLWVRKMPDFWICRRMGIKPRPYTAFSNAVARAERELEKKLDALPERSYSEIDDGRD